jgi:diguanylate cyclase (GGDEF)-like protein
MLGAVADAANDASSAEEAFRVALEEVCVATGWPVGHVYAATGGSAPGLRDIGTWHLADEARHAPVRGALAGGRLRPDEGAAGRALVSGSPERIDDVSRDDAFPSRDAVLQVGLRAACAIPVLVGAETVAVLEFFLRVAPQVDADLHTSLETVGVVIGRVVERARNEDELRRVREEFGGRIAELQERGDGVLVLEQESIRDPLTGLFNRAYLDESLRLETARANRANRPLAVIALGVDGLENLQTREGRGAAESVVRAVAEFLRNHVREGDVPCRHDDEFVILLPGVSIGMGRARARQLLKGLAAVRLESSNPVAITCSGGLACFPEHGATPATLLGGAIDALRRAAAEGGARLEQAPLSHEKWTRPKGRGQGR